VILERKEKLPLQTEGKSWSATPFFSCTVSMHGPPYYSCRASWAGRNQMKKKSFYWHIFCSQKTGIILQKWHFCENNPVCTPLKSGNL
jgi:proteasome lid subunit RPN8/RPN11